MFRFNAEIHRELFTITKNLSAYVNRVYAGKIIPMTGKNYLNIISHTMDPMLATLYTYWNFLEQNSFNHEFRTLIITSCSKTKNVKSTKISCTGSYTDLIQRIQISKVANIFDAQRLMVMDGTESDPSHFLEWIKTIESDKKPKVKKSDDYDKTLPLLLIVADNENIGLMIDKFKPDLVIIDELNERDRDQNNKFYQYLNKLCPGISVDRNIAIISFTKNHIDHWIELNKLENLIISYKCKSLPEIIDDREIDVNLRIIKMDDPKINIGKVSKSLDNMLGEQTKNIQDQDYGKPLKKILVLTKTKNESLEMYKEYKKSYMNYHNLIDVKPYNNSEMFLNLYVHADTLTIIDNHQHTRILKHAIENRTDPGILFQSTEELMESKNLMATTMTMTMRNIDSLVILDNTLKDTVPKLYQSLLTILVSNEIHKNEIYGNQMIRMNLIEILEKNLHQQLHRLGTTLYSFNRTNVEIFETIKNYISNNVITLDVEFNDMRQDKLERTLKITDTDKRIHNKNNTIYIVSLPKTKSAMINEYYQVEKEYFMTNASVNKLREEIELIKKAKSKVYSGPKWIGKKECQEIPGNKIGFADTNQGIIEVLEIVDIHKFGRRDKRTEWKEKENRNRNILFLSPVIGRYKLSKFKQHVGLSKNEPLGNMQEFIIDRNELKYEY